GAGLLDFVANPLIVRAFTRDQEIAADLKAVQILRDMGYESPRRAMAEALRAAAKVNGPPRGGWLAAQPTLEGRLGRLGPLGAGRGSPNSFMRPAKNAVPRSRLARGSSSTPPSSKGSPRTSAIGFAVAGMSCMSPRAPARDTARG